VWKDVTLPAGKVFMPELIAHSTNVVEHPDLVAERLLRYADIVGRQPMASGAGPASCSSSDIRSGAIRNSPFSFAAIRSKAWVRKLALEPDPKAYVAQSSTATDCFRNPHRT
jgi:hypothetical protein